MFHPNPSGPKLNATSPYPPENPKERTARHLRVCHELTELGMGLARGAARQATREATAHEAADTQAATAEPSPPPNPKSEPRPPAPASRKTTDPALLFTRVCSAVRQTVALEARIAVGHLPPVHRAPLHRPPPESRRDILDRVFHQVTEHLPNRAEIRRDISQSLDQVLAEDPEEHTPLFVHFDDVCQDVVFELDYAKIPKAVLKLLGEDEELEDDPPYRSPAARPLYPNGAGPPFHPRSSRLARRHAGVSARCGQKPYQGRRLSKPIGEPAHYAAPARSAVVHAHPGRIPSGLAPSTQRPTPRLP